MGIAIGTYCDVCRLLGTAMATINLILNKKLKRLCAENNFHSIVDTS